MDDEIALLIGELRLVLRLPRGQTAANKARGGRALSLRQTNSWTARLESLLAFCCILANCAIAERCDETWPTAALHIRFHNLGRRARARFGVGTAVLGAGDTSVGSAFMWRSGLIMGGPVTSYGITSDFQLFFGALRHQLRRASNRPRDRPHAGRSTGRNPGGLVISPPADWNRNAIESTLYLGSSISTQLPARRRSAPRKIAGILRRRRHRTRLAAILCLGWRRLSGVCQF